MLPAAAGFGFSDMWFCWNGFGWACSAESPKINQRRQGDVECAICFGSDVAGEFDDLNQLRRHRLPVGAARVVEAGDVAVLLPMRKQSFPLIEMALDELADAVCGLRRTQAPGSAHGFAADAGELLFSIAGNEEQNQPRDDPIHEVGG